MQTHDNICLFIRLHIQAGASNVKPWVSLTGQEKTEPGRCLDIIQWIVATAHCWKTLSDEGVASVELRGEWNIYSLRKEKIPFVGKRGQNVQERG